MSTAYFSPRRIFRAEPVFTGLALFMAALMVPTMLAWSLDARLFLGDPVWLKPFKFQLALFIYAISLALFAQFLPSGTTGKPLYRGFVYVIAFCILAEMAWIGGAAMWGTASHFNFDSAAMGSIYALMGLFAVTLTSGALVYGVLIARNRETGLPDAVRWSISAGLVLTFFATVTVASYLSSNGSHFVGAAPANETGVPLMGWSRERGDLRISHFLATHALHFIPVIGVLAALWLRERMAATIVAAATLLYAALIAFTFIQALEGKPVLA